MSERQSNIFDDPFRKAAEQYEPEFNEAAWEKMEAKLSKARRRRPFYWLRWFTDGLMMTIMVVMAIQILKLPHKTPFTKTPTVVAATENRYRNGSPNSRNEATAPAKKAGGSLKAKSAVGNKQQSSSSAVTTKSGQANPIEVNGINGRQQTQTGNPALQKADVYNAASTQTGVNKTSVLDKQPAANANERPPEAISGTIADGDSAEADKAGSHQTQTAVAVDEKLPVDSVSDITQPKPLTPEPEKNNNTARANLTENPQQTTVVKGNAISAAPQNFKGFYLHASLLPEYTYVTGNNCGPLTTAYGGGIGYIVSKRFSVQAGLYITNKIYSAGPNNYKLKRVLPANVVFTNVDAKCSVLEIPVQVNYNVLNKGPHHLLAGVGVASLIMSSEAYNYSYLYTTTGTRYYRSHTFTTNKFEPFAALLLSAGYAYNLNSKLSFIAAPDAKIPMHGVGQGKVKLSSAGVMFGLQYNILDTRKQQAKK
jgi:hypothetical protein